MLALTLRATDLAVVAVAAWLAEALIGPGGLARGETMFVGIVLLLSLSAFSVFRLYDSERLAHPFDHLPRTWAAWVATMAVAVLIMFVLRPEELPGRAWLLTWLVLGGAGLTLVHVAARAWVRHLQLAGDFGWNVVVIGSGSWGPKVRRRLDADRLEARVVGYVDLDQVANPEDVVLELRRHLTGKAVDQVALALAAKDGVRVPNLLAGLRDFPIEVGLVPEPTPNDLPLLGARRPGDLTTITCLEKPFDGWSWHLKSAFDRIAAAVMLLYLAPLMALVAVAVKLDSKGPVFYCQKRLGFNQQPIDVLKFRSMYVEQCDAPTAPTVQHATRNDPRITPVGAFLRKTSLDELPQLLNVLRGDMSLVGPRPHAIAHDEYYAAFIDGYLGRHRAKPGITGWAQINGCRGEIHSLEDMQRRIELDLHYIDHWSLWFDVRILLRTVLVFWKDERAY